MRLEKRLEREVTSPWLLFDERRVGGVLTRAVAVGV